MVETAQTFQKRTQHVVRRHEQMSVNGARARIGRDGLVSLVPRRRTPRFPLRGFATLFLAALTYKAVVLAWYGERIYTERLSQLTDGTAVERAGAWILQIDPVTYSLADFLRPYLFNLM